MHIALVGGSGFVGSALLKELLRRNDSATVLSRKPPPKQLPASVGWQVYHTTISAETLSGCDCVINLTGILNQRIFHLNDFRQVHVALVDNLCRVCQEAGVQRYLHISALNISPKGPSAYLKTKYQGEEIALHATHLNTTSFRPSVIFGPADNFLNRFANLLKWTPPPFFPLACAETLFAPVYVGDVVQRIVSSIEDPQTFRQHINLCGPHRYTLQQIVEYVAHLLSKNIRIIALPNIASYLQASICNWLPGRPFSVDNYLSLQIDSVCDDSDESLCQTRMEDIAPQYIRAA